MAVQRDPLARMVVGAAIEVHRHLGPGLLESAYEVCLAREFTNLGMAFNRQVRVPLVYKGVCVPVTYRVDFVVADQLLVEIKAIDRILPVHHAQVITYVRLLGVRQALLINFNVPRLVDGLKSFVNGPQPGEVEHMKS